MAHEDKQENMSALLQDLRADMTARNEETPPSPWWTVLSRFLFSTVMAVVVLVTAVRYLGSPLPQQEPLWGSFLRLLLVVALVSLAGDLAAGFVLFKKLRQARLIAFLNQTVSFLLTILVLIFAARHLEPLLFSLSLFLHPIPTDLPPGAQVRFNTDALDNAVTLGYWLIAFSAVIGLIDLGFAVYGLFRPRRKNKA
ncbi:MAG: hypothetical protein ACYC7E_09595 [Armatimonadota bacterium]